jgi:hypothetical protein
MPVILKAVNEDVYDCAALQQPVDMANDYKVEPIFFLPFSAIIYSFVLKKSFINWVGTPIIKRSLLMEPYLRDSGQPKDKQTLPERYAPAAIQP